MSLQYAESKTAQTAFALVKNLQSTLVKSLDELPPPLTGSRFHSVDWLRAQGTFGGGNRFVAHDTRLFDRASVNISQVQYEKDPSKKLASASALSTIVHPNNPFAPSMHMHISWTEMKAGGGYWRIMGDLNPSLPAADDTRTFDQAFRDATGGLYQEGKDQGERYFFIPALNRHRGVAHYYLEEFNSGDQKADLALAEGFGRKIIQTYSEIVRKALQEHPQFCEADKQRQLAYHTLYFLQVLTLDRGTTSGLLVHDENDTGILGSLPSHVDQKLLRSWLDRVPELHKELLSALIGCLPPGDKSLVDDAVKIKIAQVSRAFYQKHPEAVNLLASGHTVPPTKENHL